MLPSFIKDRTHDYLASGRSWYQRAVGDIDFITVHHTASTFDGTEDEILNSIFKTHNGANGWPGFSYHFFYIPKRFKGFSGKWIKLNNFEDVTWHDAVNWDSIGVSIHGYYHPDINHVLTKEDLANIKKMLDWLCTENPDFPASHGDVVGHRERQSTACPGNYLFPFVQEYRDNGGSVNWGSAEESFTLKDDISSTIEDKYDLKSKSWYSKYWTFDDYFKETIKMHDAFKTLDGNYSQLLKEKKTLETVIESNNKEIQSKTKQIEEMQVTSQELTVQLGILSKEKKEVSLANEYLTGENKRLESLNEGLVEKVDTYSNEIENVLKPTVERLKAQKFTVSESLNYLIKAIKERNY